MKKVGKKVQQLTFWPKLKWPNCQIKQKTIIEKYHHGVLEHFSVEVKSNDEGIKDLNNITRVIMKRKKNQ
jgi:hypothetical protein